MPSVLAAGSSRPIVAYPDEVLEEAVDKMIGHGVGRLPVVDREHPTKLLGYLGRKGIAEAWENLREEPGSRGRVDHQPGPAPAEQGATGAVELDVARHPVPTFAAVIARLA